ncbi:MAG: hypothetical protein R6W99_05235 [Clostridia bacterium]
MEIYDLSEMKAGDGEGGGVNVFYENELFKTRLISLGAGAEIPQCLMEDYVMFYVLDGEVIMSRNDEQAVLGKTRMLITEPARLSMKTEKGARILGIQVKINGQEG